MSRSAASQSKLEAESQCGGLPVAHIVCFGQLSSIIELLMRQLLLKRTGHLGKCRLLYIFSSCDVGRTV